MTAITIWNGDGRRNVRFSDDLAARYLQALATMEFRLLRALNHFIRYDDLEATISLYDAAIGRVDHRSERRR